MPLKLVLLKKEESNTVMNKLSSFFSQPVRICVFHWTYPVGQKW